MNVTTQRSDSNSTSDDLVLDAVKHFRPVPIPSQEIESGHYEEMSVSDWVMLLRELEGGNRYCETAIRFDSEGPISRSYVVYRDNRLKKINYNETVGVINQCQIDQDDLSGLFERRTPSVVASWRSETK